MNLSQDIQALLPEAVRLRRSLHRIPELGFQLDSTVAFVKEKLSEYGYTPADCGTHGVTATVGGRHGGKCVLIRADMDALSASARMVFCGKVAPDRALLYAARSVAVLRQDEVDALTDAYLLQRDLELTESSVIPCGETLGDLAEKASAAALDLKKKTDFR